MVSNKLVFWAAALSNPGKHADKLDAYTDFRKSSSMIRAKYYVIPGRRFWSKVFIFPNADNIKIACETLIFLSNTVSINVTDMGNSIEKVEESTKKLQRSLKIETNFDE